jgi:hypothetical protein
MNTSRNGFLSTELAVGVVLVLAMGVCATAAARDRLATARLESRAADQETALNLLDRLRRGLPTETPAGWRIERDRAPDGIDVITVTGPDHVRLQTLRRSDAH